MARLSAGLSPVSAMCVLSSSMPVIFLTGISGGDRSSMLVSFSDKHARFLTYAGQMRKISLKGPSALRLLALRSLGGGTVSHRTDISVMVLYQRLEADVDTGEEAELRRLEGGAAGAARSPQKILRALPLGDELASPHCAQQRC